MIKRLMMTIWLAGFCDVASAHVTAMSNTELDDVVLATQQPQSQQPTLPEYNSDGQVGGVTTTALLPNVPVTESSTTVTTPTASAGINPGGVLLQLPLSTLANSIANLEHNLNIPQNMGR